MPTTKRDASIVPLRDLDLGRRDDAWIGGLPAGGCRRLSPTPRVAEAARIGGHPGHVPDQADGRLIEALLDDHRLPLTLRHDRLEVEALAQHRPAALVDPARGGADLLVGVTGEVLLEEVEQTPLLLEN